MQESEDWEEHGEPGESGEQAEVFRGYIFESRKSTDNSHYQGNKDTLDNATVKGTSLPPCVGMALLPHPTIRLGPRQAQWHM